MKPIFSIRDKLVVYYATLSISSILFVGFYAYNSAREAIIDRASKQLTSVREFKKKQVEIFFSDRMRDIQILANSLENIEASRNKSLARLEQLEGIMLKSGYYSFIYYKDSGNAAFSRIKVSDSLQDERIGNLPVFGQIQVQLRERRHIIVTDYHTVGKTPTLLISIPVIGKHGRLNGYISTGIPASTINRLIFENSSFTGLGKTGETYIVGDDCLMRSSSRFFEESILLKEVSTAATLDVFKTGNGQLVTRDYRGIEVVSSYTRLHLQDLNWALLAEIDTKEILVPLGHIRNDILTIISILSIIVLVMAFVISYRITVSLTQLSKIALEIAQGKYGKTIRVTSNDEIGELTQSFNLMSSRIKEQTRELVEREKRLDSFYQATKDGILIHDGATTLLANNALAKLTGYTPDELATVELHCLIDISENEEAMLDIDKVCTMETICYKKGGEKCHVEVHKSPIVFEGSRVSSTIIHDITERIVAQKVIEKERQKQLSSFIDGQEMERKRVSRELHDGLGQSLIAIKMRLESIELPGGERNQAMLDVTKNLVDSTISDVRRMSNNLMPSALVEFGITTALANLVKQVEASTQLQISFDHRAVPRDIDEKIKMYVYRIVQEAISNAVKHAGASQLQVLLMCEAKNLVLIIEDDGKGFSVDHATAVKGNGLYHMRERVQLMNGTIEFNSEKDKGLTIFIKIPLQ